MQNFNNAFGVIILLTLFYASNSNAQSDRWIYLGEKNTVSVYIDFKTIEYDSQNNSYKVYIKLVDQDKSYQLHLEYYYCKTRRMKIVDTNYFDKYGNFIEGSEKEINSNIIPDSNPESVFNYLCK